MRLNMQDKCCCRYNKATGEVGGRVISPLHLDCVLLMEGRRKSKWIQVCVYEMSVHFCQAAYVCILLSLRSSWVYKPSSSSDPAMSNYLSSTSLNHAGILHGAAVLRLPLLELNAPYGFHLQKGWSCKVQPALPAGKCRLVLRVTPPSSTAGRGAGSKNWLVESCAAQEVGWEVQSASKAISLCSPSAEVFSIAQAGTRVPFSKGYSCEMVL